MSTSSSEVLSLTIIITTLLLLFFGIIVVRYIFLYQRKRYRHEQEIVDMRETFKQTLLQSKLEIQEQTLDHIGKELHANFSHLVSLININLSELLPQVSDQMREDILETKSLAKQLMAELKALSASLNSDYIMKIGFAQALRSELSRLSGKKKFEVIFTETGKEYSLIAEHEIILFRLCQETLNNILQYAKAKTIKASLVYLPEMFTLSIADDGIGFDIDNVAKQNMMKESTGLINIKKRAKLINAEVNIQSIIGEGTSVTVQIPKQLPL